MFDKQQFQDTFDQVQAPEALLTEVLDMTTQQKKHTPKHITRTVLIAAVLICALTITAFAAEALTRKLTGDTLSIADSFFGSSGDYANGGGIVEYDDDGKLALNIPAWSREPLDMEAAERLIAPYLYTLEENTVTVDGFTYTIHAILYDSSTETAMIRWSVENPNGLGKYGIGRNGEFSIQEGSDMFAVAGGRDYIDTAHSTDTKLYISSYAVDWQEDLTCEFGRCYDWDKGTEKAWFDTVKLLIPRDDRGGMPTVTGENVTVSPVAIRFDNARVDDLQECAILFKDGSEYTLFSDEQFVMNTTYALGDTEDNTATYTFNRIVDVEQVTAVRLNGVEIPVA